MFVIYLTVQGKSSSAEQRSVRAAPSEHYVENLVGITLPTEPLRRCIRPISGELPKLASSDLHLKRRAGRQRDKFFNLTCETALRLFQIYDANFKKKKRNY